jgi:pimeloyl-ACP methyl ester carboxylesterase
MCPDATVTAAAGVRLIAPDRPGYGGSDPAPGRTVADGAADIVEIATQLGVGPVLGRRLVERRALRAGGRGAPSRSGRGRRARRVVAPPTNSRSSTTPAGAHPRARRPHPGRRPDDPRRAGVANPAVRRPPNSILEGEGTGDAIRDDPAVQAALATMFEEALRQGPAAGGRLDRRGPAVGLPLRDVRGPSTSGGATPTR